MDKYCFSADGENYHDLFDNRKDAIEEALKECEDFKEDHVIYTAKTVDPFRYVSMDYGEVILENLECMFRDNINSEVVDGWLSGQSIKKIEDRINKEISPIIEKIINEIEPPTFYAVNHIVMYTIKEWKNLLSRGAVSWK